MRHVERRRDEAHGSTWGRGDHRWDRRADEEFDRTTQAGGAGWTTEDRGAERGSPLREGMGSGFDPNSGQGGVYGRQSGYGVPGSIEAQSNFPHADWTQSESSPRHGWFGTHWPVTPPDYGTEGSLGGYGYGPTTRPAHRQGPFAGLGPKTYRRSDERIHEDVCERLTDEGELDASDIDVTVEGGEVTLSGTVPDRRAKRLAEDLVEECSGVTQVHNDLRVGSSERRGTEREDGQSSSTSKSGRKARTR